MAEHEQKDLSAKYHSLKEQQYYKHGKTKQENTPNGRRQTDKTCCAKKRKKKRLQVSKDDLRRIRSIIYSHCFNSIEWYSGAKIETGWDWGWMPKAWHYIKAGSKHQNNWDGICRRLARLRRYYRAMYIVHMYITIYYVWYLCGRRAILL